VLLLIFSALPVLSLAFLFGGVPATAVVPTQISVFVSGLLFVCVGAFYSCLFKRTARAAILSYLTVGLLSLFPLFSFMFFGVLTSSTGGGFSGPTAVMTMVLELCPFLGAVTVATSWLSGTYHSALFWFQVTVLHLLLSGVLYVLAGSRIRPVGRGVFLSLAGLVLLLWTWALLVIGTDPLSNVFGSGGVP